MADTNHPDNTAMARLRLALERELHAGETVEWHGWQLGRIDPKHFLIYVFAVPWTAFSLMWTVLAAGAMSVSDIGLVGIAFPLFGLPFIAIGGWMLARPFVPLWERGRVLYVITDRRVIKLALGRELVVKTVPADRLGLAERRERPDGTGTLSLAVRIGRDSDGDKQTETFDIGPVADITGAGAAIDRIAAAPRPQGPSAAALSS
jgi:hypothetical protein